MSSPTVRIKTPTTVEEVMALARESSCVLVPRGRHVHIYRLGAEPPLELRGGIDAVGEDVVGDAIRRLGWPYVVGVHDLVAERLGEDRAEAVVSDLVGLDFDRRRAVRAADAEARRE